MTVAKQDVQGGTIELEELSESLEETNSPPVLASGTVVTAPNPDAKSLRIERFLHARNRTNHYEAVSEDSPALYLVQETQDDFVRSCLREEYHALRKLNCPMFRKVFDYFEIENRAYLVAERISAPSLADLMATAQLPLAQVLSAVSQAAFALGQLHTTGLVCLGVRPSTIVVSKPIKLVDFAYLTRLGEKPSRVFYHAGYSPPELFAGLAVNEQADIYSLGAVLFHALTGSAIPETGPELSVWQSPNPIAGLPQVLHRCLGPQDTRYKAMAELHRDLVRLMRRNAPCVQYDVSASSSIGLEPSRTTNQDAFGHRWGQIETEELSRQWGVAVVADGMGGMMAGDVASQIAVQTLLADAETLLTKDPIPTPQEQASHLVRCVHSANERVFSKLNETSSRGGCTLVAISILGQRMAIAHVGDCRVYLVRAGSVTQLTRDHSLVMGLVLQGEVELSELRTHPDRSTVTRSLGERKTLPDYYVDTLEQSSSSPTIQLQPEDLLLLCSDGLWEPVLEQDLLDIATRHQGEPLAVTRDLISLALTRGGRDNATVLAVRAREFRSSN